MNWLVYHIASGHSFFTGVVLLVAAALCSIQARPVLRRFAGLSCLIGLIAVIVSSTPSPYWLIAGGTVVTVGWAVSFARGKNVRRWAIAMAAAWSLAGLIELPYHFTRQLRPVPSRSLAVVGDSVTAGMGDGDTAERWPAILSREQDLQVQDLSHVGETASSALRRIQGRPIDAQIVVVEIGGNDLLGSTTADKFAEDLDALLAHLAAPNRQLVMFELPLPPLSHAYGRAQRTVAAKHQVVLIPKHEFLSVLAGSDSTLDTIHLSQDGHRRMADCVWRHVHTAFDSSQP
ncbi:MAG: GDSL-type esterase/lipase family protein [Pirellulales bacterium]